MRFLPFFAAAVFALTGCSESDKTTTTVAPTTEPVTTTTTTSFPAQTLSDALDSMIEKLAENNVDKKTMDEMHATLSSLAESIKPEDMREFVLDYLVKREALLKSAFEKCPAEIRSNAILAPVIRLLTDFFEAPGDEKKAAAEKLVTCAFDKLLGAPKPSAQMLSDQISDLVSDGLTANAGDQGAANRIYGKADSFKKTFEALSTEQRVEGFKKAIIVLKEKNQFEFICEQSNLFAETAGLDLGAEQMALDVQEADAFTIDAKAHTLATTIVDFLEQVKSFRG